MGGSELWANTLRLDQRGVRWKDYVCREVLKTMTFVLAEEKKSPRSCGCCDKGWL